MFSHSLSDGFVPVSLAPQCESSIGPGRRSIGINRSIFLQLRLLKFYVVLALLRVLLLFTATAQTETGSKTFDCALVLTLETYDDPDSGN